MALLNFCSVAIVAFEWGDFTYTYTGNEPLSELEAVIEATSQFTQDILDLALESIKENKLPNLQYTKVCKQPDAESSLAALNAQQMEEWAENTAEMSLV